jgi:GT2 family glycosyltransferase
MSGWAFMLRGESGLRFDEQFEWWYGDSDLERQVRLAGKQTVCVGGCYANHLYPMLSSKDPARLVQAKEDERRFAVKYGLDPTSLWLAQHPDFGA